MPVTVDEQPEKQQFGSTGRRQYYIRGAADADEARTALLASPDAPATWEAGGRTLTRDDDQCDVFEMGSGAGITWFGVAYYVPQEQVTGGGGAGSSFSFDTTGATEHIMASRSTAAYDDGAGATDGDNGNLIRVKIDDGVPSVEGVDITVGKLGFTVTKRFDIADVDSDYIDTLAELTGSVNLGTVTIITDDGIEVEGLGGELLFFGATGGVNNGQVEITFYFGKSPNVTGTIGGIDFVAAGWEYVWPRYRPYKLAGMKVMGAIPIAVYVETVYESRDWTGLLG